MRCLECDNNKFEVRDACFIPEIKGRKVEVIVPAYVCTQCQTPLMDGTQMNVLRRGAEEKYGKLVPQNS